MKKEKKEEHRKEEEKRKAEQEHKQQEEDRIEKERKKEEHRKEEERQHRLKEEEIKEKESDEEKTKEEEPEEDVSDDLISDEKIDAILNEGSTNEESDEVECKIYEAVFAIKGRSDRELDMKVGDEVAVFDEADGGWWRGQNLTTKYLGWFPNNYVKDTGRTIFMPAVEKSDVPEEGLEGLEQVEDDEDGQQRKISLSKVVSPTISEIQKKLKDQGTGVFAEDQEEVE